MLPLLTEACVGGKRGSVQQAYTTPNSTAYSSSLESCAKTHHSEFKKKQVVGSPAHLLQSSSDSHISIKTTTTGCWIIGSLAHLLQSHGHSHISIKHRLLDHWVTGTSATVSWSFSHFNKKQQQVVGSLGHWHICYSLMVILTFQ